MLSLSCNHTKLKTSRYGRCGNKQYAPQPQDGGGGQLHHQIHRSGKSSSGITIGKVGKAIVAMISFTIFFPVIIDLDDDGLELMSLDKSNVFYDIEGLGFMNNIGWCSKKDAFLAVDIDQDYIISMGKEISFKLWDENAKTDLDGLRLAFDSNKDGKITKDDEMFDQLVVWQDANQNGVSEEREVKSLQEVGIEEILLNETTQVHPNSQVEGNIILSAVKLKTDGRIKSALYDIGLETSDAGIYSEENEGTIELYYGNKEKIAVLQSDIIMDLNKGNYTVAIGDERHQNFIANNNENSVMDGGAGDDNFIGGDKNDWAKGGSGSDTYAMGKGHDIMLIDSEDESIDGGEDYDIVIVATREAVTLDMAKANVEAAYGNKGNDIFNASQSKVGVFIDGGAGDDELEGSDHADVLIGGKGKDKIKAGKGDDVIYIDSEDDLSQIDAGEGEDTVFILGENGIKLDPAIFCTWD